jgi:hypothetical protein
LRRRLPLFAALAFGIAVGAVAALDLPSRLDASAVVGKRGTAEAAQRAQIPAAIVQQTPMTPVPDTSRVPVPKAKVAKPPAPRPRTAPAVTTATTAPTTTSAARPTPPAVPPAATTSAATTTQKPAAPRSRSARTTAPPATTTAPPSPPPRTDFTPSRNWAWPPADGADYYLVEFFRGGQLFYKATPTEARLTLPESIDFVPGLYRWRVRPGRGAPSANQLDAPIVDSEFILNS